MSWWYGIDYRPITQKAPMLRKKDRKAKLQLERHRKKYGKWMRAEPKRWRLIAHWRWEKQRPAPYERRE